ncbi:hypothetical protein ABMA27_013570 [Loxostege sticticalis]|uniref:Uncharacterized protein n=1 Tax=Loxostege sticticalis TaxID=481309 RepID=A0ABR3IFS6_LOXSC
MVVKFVVILAFVAAATASDISSFAYDVADPYTGDFKSQTETRVGGNVAGQYSLLDADGTKRTVDYTAGAEGFNAIVRKDPAVISTPITPTPIIQTPIIPTNYVASAYPYSAYPYSAYPYSAYPYSAYPINYNYPYASFTPYARFSPYAYAKYSPYAYAKYF